MAGRGTKAVSGAAAGAGIGGSVGGPIGAGVGAVIGGIGGFLFGDDEEPEFVAPSFADIDLETENPELYEELMKVYAANSELEKAYRNRISGPSYADRNEIANVMSGVNNRLSHQGLLGSSVGIAAAADADTLLRERIEERAMQEANALRSAWMNGMLNAANFKKGMQDSIMNSKLGQATANYNAAREDEAASNAMWSGIFNGGVALGANAINNAKMDDLYAKYKGSPAPGSPAPDFYVPSQPTSGPGSYDPDVPFFMR